jgi:mannose/cellobiose epimerase-like protein (N-acyl-D-glucosamine 2-epimerase family)
VTADPAPWIDNPGHRAWLSTETGRLLDFYLAAADFADGGFWALDGTGRPDTARPKELWVNARLVHCFALGSLLGHPGSTALVRHGLDGLRRVFHDPGHGGWFWTTADPRKQTYGHAFVLLAACSAAAPLRRTPRITWTPQLSATS